MSLPEQHVFVCTNEREPTDSRGCCKARGGEKVLEAFRLELLARGLKGKIRANKAGCLDQCSMGTAVVIYPQTTWYANVETKDVPEIVDSMQKGGKVVRLLHPENK